MEKSKVELQPPSRMLLLSAQHSSWLVHSQLCLFLGFLMKMSVTMCGQRGGNKNLVGCKAFINALEDMLNITMHNFRSKW